MVPHGCQTNPSGLHGLQQRFSPYQPLKCQLTGVLHMAQYQFNNKAFVTLINPADFSILPRLLCVTAYVFKFVQLLQKKVTQQGPVTAMEHDHAMTEWVKNRQSVVFHAEVANLSSKSRHHTIWVYQFCCFLDDNAFYTVAAGCTMHF